MNRSERRRLERSNKDESMTEMYLDISDTCIIGALDDFGLNINDISEILKNNSKYLIGYTEYIEKQGGFGMIKNEELSNRVKTKILRCMEGKMNKAKALKLLKNEFNLPLAVLSDLWIECKVDNNNKSVKKDSNYDIKMGTSLDHDECLITSIEEYDEVNTPAADSINNKVSENKTMEECVVTKEIESGLDYDGDKVVEIKKNNLTVIDRSVTVRGQYGTYIKGNDGVSVDSKLYNDRSAISKSKHECAEMYKNRMISLQTQINDLMVTLRETENAGIRQIEQYTELESVFDMSF